MKLVRFGIPQDIHTKLKAAALAKGISITQLLREYAEWLAPGGPLHSTPEQSTPSPPRKYEGARKRSQDPYAVDPSGDYDVDAINRAAQEME